MPNLKHLTCMVEWSGSAIPLQEHQTTYGDGYVQTYVAVPELPTPFTIRLRSHGYIAPGLAMYVYIDGEYQVNRFRQNLKIPDGKTTRRQTEVDFLVRQKEEMLEDGTFEGKQWRFENLNLVTAPSEHAGPLAVFNGEYVGTIEVVVLRCYPGEVSSSAEHSSLVSSPQSPNHVKTSNKPETSKGSQKPKDQQKPKEPQKPKDPKKATPSTSADDDSSSSTDDTNSDDNPPKAMGSMVDGADERPHGAPSTLVFGGDMARDDDPPPRKNSPRRGRGSNSGLFKRGYIPKSQRGSPGGKKSDNSWGGSSISQHFNDDWETYNPPGGRNSPEPQATAGRNSKQKSPNLSKRTTSPGVSANPSLKNSPQVNVPVPAGQPSPAIIINVNHGGVSPASIAPSVLAPDAPTVHGWALREGQNEKANEKNSSASGGSSGSKNGSEGFKEHKKKASWAMNMPGGWGASNVESHANSTGWNDNPDNGAQPDDGWNNGNNNQQDKNDCWNNNGESSEQQGNNYGATTSGAQKTNTDWNNNGNDENKEKNGWNDNGNGDNENGGSWDINGNGNGDSKNEDGWNNNGTTAAPTSGWSWGNAGKEKENEEPQAWGGAIEKKNGWDMPKKEDNGFQGKAASEKSSVFPKHNMEFTRLPNVMSTTGKDKPADPNTWPNNEATLNYAPQQAPIAVPLFQPKPYWSTWNQLPGIPEEQKAPEPPPEPPAPPVDPLPGVPVDVATRNNTSHQVHTDRPAPYVHRTSAANHMDTLEAPYAVFIFKYRSNAILEKMLNTTLTEPEAEQKRRLSSLSKEELIEHYLRAKANASTPSTASTVVPASIHSTGNTNNNGNTAPAAGLDFGNALSQKLNQLNINTPNTLNTASTNPSHHWGRSNHNHKVNNNPTANWSVLPSSPPSNPVPGWFNTGGGEPVTTPTHGAAALVGSTTNRGDGGQAGARASEKAGWGGVENRNGSGGASGDGGGRGVDW